MSKNREPRQGDAVYDTLNEGQPNGEITSISWEDGERSITVVYFDKEVRMFEYEEFEDFFIWSDKFGGLWRNDL